MTSKTYYVTCKYDTMIGPDNDEGDGTRYSGFSHEVYYNHRFRVFESNNKPVYPDECYICDIDPSYIVAVIYGDGGTFGRTDGYVQYIGAFSLEKARNIITLINQVKHEPRYYGDKEKAKEFNKNKKDLYKLINNSSFYAQWLGYFSSFEGMYLLGTNGSVEEISL